MEDIKLTKSLKKQEYMRNYMKNYYHKHQEDANIKCLGRYYKKKRNIAEEDLELFKEHIAIIIKAKECLEKVKKECPQFLDALFETYKSQNEEPPNI
jgi:hypothetical protein